MIEYKCPHCGERLVVDDGKAGQIYRCSLCSQDTTVPGTARAAAQPPPTHSYQPPERPARAAAPQKQGPIPGWAWIFAVACGIIPVLTLGGALPGALGFGAAAGCVSVARNETMSLGLRIVLCLVTTLIAWGLLLGLLGVVVLKMLQGGSAPG